MSPFNFLENVFNQLLVNPRSSEQDRRDQVFLKNHFEKIYGDKNYFLISSSGSAKVENESTKLIALRHDAVMNSAKRVNANFGLDKSMSWGSVLPLYHVAGLGIYARAFLTQSQVYQSSWNVTQFIPWIEQNNINLVSLVPTQIYDLIQNNCKSPKSVRLVFIGGARLDDELRDQIKNLGWPITETYGMTETASMIATGQASKMRVLPDIEIGIHNDCLKIKCDSLMTCSLQKIENEVQIKTLDKGWLVTQDRAEVSVVGNFVELNLLGRDSDFVKINAEGVSVSGLRDILGPHDGLTLLALPEARSGNEIVAVKEKNFQAQEIIKSYNSRVRPFERIGKIFTVNQFPKTDLGKIKYKALEGMLEGLSYENI
ncbi:MAG: hypothetical protein A2622_03340 [Bdellovibrionales bacterium RIFCSPHIGHO2_01_FULL_40_29]|nr:MAG: hypothetical protein A2622_03340 [Bdellovibrionales bacterium RIFCSPHIGHO2_01_FULL_40_29]OFZ34102.1 MAG: hypothetical protein A3D17_03760 [Bdellovibrionales bacterium RIFCSPHIGHO2_02_FULL_40_15]